MVNHNKCIMICCRSSAATEGTLLWQTTSQGIYPSATKKQQNQQNGSLIRPAQTVDTNPALTPVSPQTRSHHSIPSEPSKASPITPSWNDFLFKQEFACIQAFKHASIQFKYKWQVTSDKYTFKSVNTCWKFERHRAVSPTQHSFLARQLSSSSLRNAYFLLCCIGMTEPAPQISYIICSSTFALEI